MALFSFKRLLDLQLWKIVKSCK